MLTTKSHSLNPLYTANYKPCESLVAPKVHFKRTDLNMEKYRKKAKDIQRRKLY